MSARLPPIQDWERLALQARFRPDVMAALCSISLRHLERLFELQINQTPRDWMRQLQCRLALHLISQGWSTKAVAEELKFADSSHLSRHFKRIYGAAPQKFAPRPRFLPKNVARVL